MKSLVVDGNWLLKRNFKRIEKLDSYKSNCGGVYGFLLSLQFALRQIFPDRVIVMWDGFNAGKYRYDVYKPYKANRKKEWEREESILKKKFRNPDDEEEYHFIIQKIKTKNILEELFVRQIETDFVEADDLIAGYILESEKNESNEEIVIFSRDKDFRQLVSSKVSILTPNSDLGMITINNFQNKIGHTVDNELLFKCFEGDSSDGIDGVKGINRNTILKYFPSAKENKITYQEMVDHCNYMLNEEKKKLKTFQKIIEARDVLYRNAQLMNLKKPFLNEEAKNEIENWSSFPLDLNRSIDRALMTLKEDGYISLMMEANIDIDQFFAPFYRLMSQEKKYRKEENID